MSEHVRDQRRVVARLLDLPDQVGRLLQGHGHIVAPFPEPPVTGTAGRVGTAHPRRQPRSAAPTRSAATATAASRTSVASAAVSVRSGARTTMAKASDLRSGTDLITGVDVEQPHRLQQLTAAVAQRVR